MTRGLGIVVLLAASAWAQEPRTVRLGLGSFSSTTTKFPSKSVLGPLTTALEKLAPAHGCTLVHDASTGADQTVSVTITPRGRQFSVYLVVVSTDAPELNAQRTYVFSKPHIGVSMAQAMAKQVLAFVADLDAQHKARVTTETPAPVPEVVPTMDEEIPEMEEEADPLFRPSLKGFVQAFGSAVVLDDDAMLSGIASLKASPRGFMQLNLQPQLKTRGDHVSFAGDLSLYGSSTGPHGLFLMNELYADAQLGPVRLLVGRKRVVWGSGLAVNPTDILNPMKDPLLPNLQRVGSLMLPMVDVTVGPFVFTGLVSMGVKTNSWGIPIALESEKTIVAARVYALLAGFDLNAMYYRDQNRKQHLVGFTGSRFFGDWVELHTELLARFGAPELPKFAAIPGCGEAIEDSSATWTGTALAGARVHFPDQSRLVAEYFFNGNGLDTARFDQLKKQAPCVADTLALVGGPPALEVDEHPLGFPTEQLFVVRPHHVFLTYERPHMTTGLLEDLSAMCGLVFSPEDLSAIVQVGLGYTFGGRTTIEVRGLYWAGRSTSELGGWPGRFQGLASVKVAL